MKIALITLYANNNYGNKLQNYALQEYLNRKFGVKVETIVPKKPLLFTLKYLLKVGKYKNKQFKRFDKYITKFKKKIDINCKVFDYKFDYLLFGSDQIWNTSFEGKFNLFYANFYTSIKKISYAASFGKSFIDEDYTDFYKKSLADFSHISVREEQGERILQDLFPKRKIEVLIDPTMLLNAEEWDHVSKKPTMLTTSKYILNYFLGELSDSRKKEIERVAKENNCEIINILDKDSPFYECGPSEFLYLEKNAFLICTDSFHSCVFAILYNRPFIIYDREQETIVSMNSRIDTLINKFQLKNRKFEGKITEKNLKHNYEEAYKILEKERQKSERFLKEALDIKE